MGGLTASELRHVTPSDQARSALIEGLTHTSPKVRWWCLQLIDHTADEASLAHFIPLLHDEVPRVRKMARHVLECEPCKQTTGVVEAGRWLLREFDS